MVFEHLQGWGLHHCPGQPGPTPDRSSSKEIVPNIQSEPPLMQLEAIASRPITGYLGEETNPRLTITSFQVAVESEKVPPQPPLLQTEQPQLPQPLLIRLVLSFAGFMASRTTGRGGNRQWGAGKLTEMRAAPPNPQPHWEGVHQGTHRDRLLRTDRSSLLQGHPDLIAHNPSSSQNRILLHKEKH